MDPDFLSVDDVLELHAKALRDHGGSEGLRDLGLLDSAVAQAQAGFGGEWLHRDVWAMSAAYAFHIAENQPFLDGNKRTALAAALLFLDFNGVAPIPEPHTELADALLAIAARDLTKDGFADLLARLAGQERVHT